MWSKVAVPIFFMWKALFKLQSPLGTRPAGQQGREPYTSTVGTTISLEAPVETQIFCCDIPLTGEQVSSGLQGSKERRKERGYASQRCATCTTTEAQNPWLFSAFPFCFTPGDSARGIIPARPLCLLFSRHRHSRVRSLSQIKGHSAFFPLSTLRRNVALPLIFAVFSQRGLTGPCNVNPVLPPRTRWCSKGADHCHAGSYL